MRTGARLPPGLAGATRFPYRLLTWGIPMGPLTLLRTRGRRSGLLRTVPVAMLRHQGGRWLVSPFGETDWVRSVRADPRAELGRGRLFHRVRLTEINDDRNPEILHAYRRTFGLVPFVRDAFAAAPDEGPLAFARQAHRHPVFIIQRID
ncbi:nitroreductase family deazaflavin-dependent oxidoreductase [Nonomuraea sp. 3N208]|uniref:nitroreductase family deazaflavin-dependent oxidoreductase n=1 Tax=Nonomuraea sp. 3N208 TaxID=3457421 RepID=UPI003FD40ED5